MIKVFGHISPDTDTVGSAILWAWYLNNKSPNQATPFVLGKLNKETSFVLNYWNIAQPELLESITSGEQVIIVDTNNPQELFTNISETDIVQIIDHHKLTGGLSTNSPIDVTIKPLASTAAVIYDLMGEHAQSLPKEMAGLLLSCILSDTLAFRSPTTTAHDKEIAETLAAQLEIDITSYSDEMFAAKSDLSDLTEAEIIQIDSKKTVIGDKTIRVSVVETTTPAFVIARKTGLVSAMTSLLADESATKDILFFIVDILKEESTVFTYNAFTREIITTSFGVSSESDTVVLPRITSRKKQIIPVLKLPNEKNK